MTETSHYRPEEKKMNQHRIFLEIGPGPIPAAKDSTRHFMDGDAYVSVERNAADYHEEDMFGQQKEETAQRRDKENIFLTEGDARHMQFPDESVHEVFMGNVLSGIPAEDREPVLREAHRVMDGTGNLIVDTDTQAEEYEPGFFEDMAQQLEAAGFIIDDVIDTHSDPEAYADLRGLWPSGEWPDGHIFTVARKADTPMN